MTTEYWDAYLPDGSRTDHLLTRGQPIPAGYYHLVVEAMIAHTDGSLLFVQRDASRPSFPGYWEFSCGGSALAGEMAEQAIRRETLEEIGLQLEQVNLYKTYLDERYQCYFQIFQATTDADKTSLRLQKGETAAYRWVQPADLPQFLADQDLIPSQKDSLLELYLKKD